jgi:hypothetical protein
MRGLRLCPASDIGDSGVLIVKTGCTKPFSWIPRFWRFLYHQKKKPMRMSIRPRIPTPAPIPAFALVDSPLDAGTAVTSASATALSVAVGAEIEVSETRVETEVAEAGGEVIASGASDSVGEKAWSATSAGFESM